MTLFHLLAEGFAVCVRDPEWGLRVGRPASFNKRPDKDRGQQTRHSDADHTFDIADAGANQPRKIFVSAQDRGSLFVEALAGSSRLDPARAPLQKRDAE